MCFFLMWHWVKCLNMIKPTHFDGSRTAFSPWPGGLPGHALRSLFLFLLQENLDSWIKMVFFMRQPGWKSFSQGSQCPVTCPNHLAGNQRWKHMNTTNLCCWIIESRRIVIELWGPPTCRCSCFFRITSKNRRNEWMIEMEFVFAAAAENPPVKSCFFIPRPTSSIYEFVLKKSGFSIFSGFLFNQWSFQYHVSSLWNANF